MTNEAYLEILDIRSGSYRHTGQGAAFETDEETRAQFEAARALEVGDERGEFTLDLHEGYDLVDTILLDAAGFKQITGQEPADPQTYVEYDQMYWESQRLLEAGYPPETMLYLVRFPAGGIYANGALQDVAGGPVAYEAKEMAQDVANLVGGSVIERKLDYLIEFCQKTNYTLWMRHADGRGAYFPQTVPAKANTEGLVPIEGEEAQKLVDLDKKYERLV